VMCPIRPWVPTNWATATEAVFFRRLIVFLAVLAGFL